MLFGKAADSLKFKLFVNDMNVQQELCRNIHPDGNADESKNVMLAFNADAALLHSAREVTEAQDELGHGCCNDAQDDALST